MKVKHTLLVGSVIFLSMASLAFAKDASVSGDPTHDGHPARMERQALHEDLQQNRQEFRASMSADRAQMKAQYQAERDAFKTKVTQLKDQKKQLIVTDVTDRFTTINMNQTKRMTESLTKLSSILDNLSTKAAGKDTATGDSAITTAKAAIATAQTAVSAQAAKQYIPQITDDTTLRQNVNTTFIQFKSDLTTTHQSITTAKKAVLTVAQDVAKIPGGTK